MYCNSCTTISPGKNKVLVDQFLTFSSFFLQSIYILTNLRHEASNQSLPKPRSGFDFVNKLGEKNGAKERKKIPIRKHYCVNPHNYYMRVHLRCVYVSDICVFSAFHHGTSCFCEEIHDSTLNPLQGLYFNPFASLYSFIAFHTILKLAHDYLWRVLRPCHGRKAVLLVL